jgi:hypothetical protein
VLVAAPEVSVLDVSVPEVCGAPVPLVSVPLVSVGPTVVVVTGGP